MLIITFRASELEKALRFSADYKKSTTVVTSKQAVLNKFEKVEYK